MWITSARDVHKSPFSKPNLFVHLRYFFNTAFIKRLYDLYLHDL